MSTTSTFNSPTPQAAQSAGAGRSHTPWHPVAGDEWSDFVKRNAGPKDLGPAGVTDLLLNCQGILGRCGKPGRSDAPRTELVLGCIQSGKTLSFTGVTCLARDNDYRIVVVITGTSMALLGQSRGRLESDLGLGGTGGSGWLHFEIQPGIPHNPVDLANALKAWDHPGLPSHLRRTVLVTVLKNHANLERATELLRTAAMKLPHGLNNIPVLVIDDEADQASLNTKARTGNGVSTIYRKIGALRATVPNHSFLQYTATAQANLLLTITDILSPDHCHVLEPGPGYTGGKVFMRDRSELVRTIPGHDLPVAGAPQLAPPDSMSHAMRVFLVGLAQVIDQKGVVRSMLLHPSRQMADHSVCDHMVGQMLNDWASVLGLSTTDQDRIDLVEMFREAWTDLSTTAKDLRPFDDLLRMLPIAITHTSIKVMNSQRGTVDDEFPWSNSPGWILIGGQALDRGLTVKGLTVTYMARDLPAAGKANADTLQQRARFYGYRASYLDYCRIYLTGDVRAALADYVAHEEVMRGSLRDFATTGRPLSEWRRIFMLDGSMSPTRRGVVAIPYRQFTSSAAPAKLGSPHTANPELDENRELVAALRAHAGWTAWDPGVPAGDHHDHRKLVVPLDSLLEGFLVRWRATAPDDADALQARIIQSTMLLQRDPRATATIVDMSGGAIAKRLRAVEPDGKVVNLMQGQNATLGAPNYYPGDAAIHEGSGVTVQIHSLDLRDHDNPKTILARDIPTLVIFCGDRVDLVVQPQGVFKT